MFVTGCTQADQCGSRFFAWIGCVQTFLIGQDDQGIGFDQVGNQCTQRVVITEADFIGGNGIVFVDDGQDAQIEQGADGGAGVQIARAIGQIFVREQNLGGTDAVSAEGLLVRLC